MIPPKVAVVGGTAGPGFAEAATGGGGGGASERNVPPQ